MFNGLEKLVSQPYTFDRTSFELDTGFCFDWKNTTRFKTATNYTKIIPCYSILYYQSNREKDFTQIFPGKQYRKNKNKQIIQRSKS